MLDVVQRRSAHGEARLVGPVPLGHPRVEIPAVVVEPGACRDLPDVGERLLLERGEPDDDVGHLHAGVVDVVLHFDGHAAEAQHAHERVAERRVAQVPDVRRLVRVDGGVLDDGLARRCPAAPRDVTGGVQALGQERRLSRNALRYPLPSASTRATPATGISAAASSCAMARGAFRRRLASSKAIGTARSPSARFGA